MEYDTALQGQLQLFLSVGYCCFGPFSSGKDTMKKPILILDYSVDGRSGGQISRWFNDPVSVERIKAEIKFPELCINDYRAVIHSGSALSILDDHPFLSGAEEFLRLGSREGIPQMGICYGHQLLARALAGVDAVARCSSVELGWLPVQFLPSWPGGGLSGRKAVWQSHYDCIVKLPPESVVTATSPHTEIQAFFNEKMRIFGTQFHPEFDREAGNQCFSRDPGIFESNGISLSLTLAGGPGFNTGEVVFTDFLKTFEQEF